MINTGVQKVFWTGRVNSIHPRIRLTRPFNERSHTYLGYVLRVEGLLGDEQRTFAIGIGKAAQAEHQFRAGDLGGIPLARDPNVLGRQFSI